MNVHMFLLLMVVMLLSLWLLFLLVLLVLLQTRRHSPHRHVCGRGRRRGVRGIALRRHPRRKRTCSSAPTSWYHGGQSLSRRIEGEGCGSGEYECRPFSRPSITSVRGQGLGLATTPPKIQDGERTHDVPSGLDSTFSSSINLRYVSSSPSIIFVDESLHVVYGDRNIGRSQNGS